MKKKHIYSEFDKIAKLVQGDCRKAQKYYVMQMCEQLGKVDHRQTFVMWCSRKRVLAYQQGKSEPAIPNDAKNGRWYLFPKNADAAIEVEGLESI